jgi:hypothetical protein
MSFSGFLPSHHKVYKLLTPSKGFHFSDVIKRVSSTTLFSEERIGDCSQKQDSRNSEKNVK